jgi:hypothetical protein
VGLAEDELTFRSSEQDGESPDAENGEEPEKLEAVVP